MNRYAAEENAVIKSADERNQNLFLISAIIIAFGKVGSSASMPEVIHH